MAATYKPFGEPLVITGPAALDARFPGQWFQFESGLAWNWYRHYDASLGRYTQPDPLGVSQGPSVYGYVGQSPLMAVDPQGLQSAAVPFGPPMILPPVAIAGTPENRAWTNWALSVLPSMPGSWNKSSVYCLSALAIADYLGAQITEMDKKSGKEKATDVPSWAEGQKPLPGESGREFADRIIKQILGTKNYETGPKSDFNKLKKFGDRRGK